jgi:phosphate acyltransferase
MTEYARVAIDAMSGDNDPAAAVHGGLDALLRSPELRILLVGQRVALERAAGAWSAAHADATGWQDRVEVVEAGDVITMDEHPAQAVRAKKDASVVVACRLVAEGRADGAVSAGNSGATLAAALFALKRVPGVSRPAMGIAFPNPTGTTYLLDVGANTDCKPEWLAQFAVMGSIYAQQMLDIPNPRVGLISNGEEAEKGSQLVVDGHALLRRQAGIDFIGNVEGRDLFTGRCDVAVTDGFSGNVALKTAEGAAEFLFATISREARVSLTGKIGGALLKPRLRPLRDRVDYRKTGGALLLGVAGEVVIAHGRSDAEAMANAVAVAERAFRRGMARRIGEQLTRARPGPAAVSAQPQPRSI